MRSRQTLLAAVLLAVLGVAHTALAAGEVYVSGHASFGYGGGSWGWGYPYWSYPYYPYGYGYGPYWGWSYVPGARVWVTGNPEEIPAVVETDVRPKKAEVWIDGKPAGQARDFSGTWDRIWIEPGRHEIELRRTGYRTLRLVLDLEPGGLARIVERLEKGEGVDPRSTAAPTETARDAAPPGELRRALLRLDVEPADAAVYLDGQFLAHAAELARLHGAIPVAEGTHRVEVVRPGYAAEQQDVQVSAEQPLHLRIALRRAEAS